MGQFLRKIMNFLDASESFHVGFSSEDAAKDFHQKLLRRKSPRLEISTHLIMAWAETSDGTRMPVINLSYGGLAIIIPKKLQNDISNLRDHLKLRLHVDHKSIDTSVSIAYIEKGVAGCTFVHADDQTLKFLRGILEFIRLGKSLNEMEADCLSPQYKGDNHSVYRGDLATTLSVHRNYSGGIDKCELSFRDGTKWNRIYYADGALHFHRFGDDTGKITALEQGLFTFIGAIQLQKIHGLDIIAEAFRETIAILDVDKG